MLSSTDNQHESETIRRLREQVNEISALAGALAHEIKNPLSVIAMNMELLAEDMADAKTPQELRALAKVGIVKDQCERLENLLDDFLKFARVRTLDLSPGDQNRLSGCWPSRNRLGAMRHLAMARALCG